MPGRVSPSTLLKFAMTPPLRKVVVVMLSLAGWIGSGRLDAQTGYEMPLEFSEAGEVYGEAERTTTNRMLWQQYQMLHMPPEEDDYGCRPCVDQGAYDRCGCTLKMFRWFSGPGFCDSWCVGPHWDVTADGLMWFQEDADFTLIPNSVGGDVVDQFNNGSGVRLFATAFNNCGYGMQVGYEGINDWDASFTPNNVAGREVTYQSRINSLEFNFLKRMPRAMQIFSGFRFLQLDEDLIDFTTEPRAAPVFPGEETFVDSGNSYLVENQLFGFQLGARRDAWNFGRWLSLESFVNAGVYCNQATREFVDLTVTTTVTPDDPSTVDTNEYNRVSNSFQSTEERRFSEIAFVGEAGLSAVLRINQCLAVRGGYQMLVVDGVSPALFDPTLVGFNGETNFYHGLKLGVEYRR